MNCKWRLIAGELKWTHLAERRCVCYHLNNPTWRPIPMCLIIHRKWRSTWRVHRRGHEKTRRSGRCVSTFFPLEYLVSCEWACPADLTSRSKFSASCCESFFFCFQFKRIETAAGMNSAGEVCPSAVQGVAVKPKYHLVGKRVVRLNWSPPPQKNYSVWYPTESNEKAERKPSAAEMQRSAFSQMLWTPDSYLAKRKHFRNWFEAR